MRNENSTNYQVQWLIAEYLEIRKQIERRSKEQFVCITASIISLGSTLVFISKSPSVYYPLLIVVPWILTIFGLIWTDHSHHIFLLGAYIRKKIERQINEIAMFKRRIGWQHNIHDIRLKLKEGKKKPALIVWLLPLIYFILPSLSCMITYAFIRLEFRKLPLPIEISLLLVGAILIVCLIITWFRASQAITK